ncbi:MAG TPA: succinyl-diaminopimelate desuccinylase [Acidimicrobiales bacterium]|nr:succinyl-diaminopimelate desuccinylase [Acidimicrobiales bacterium]
MSRLADALELVAVDSQSGREATLAGVIERRLRTNERLEVERIGDNVVARTTGLHATRVLIAGHLDTVPGDITTAHIDGDQLHGLGATDMKGSLAVMAEIASQPGDHSVEVTWVFYAREEIARHESGLLEIAELRPELLSADVALLGEPTGGAVEAGCQGTMRVGIVLAGQRAHTARPFRGRNAIHRMGELLARVAEYEPRRATIDGVEFTEQLQAVLVEGGVANNVVPDRCACTLNYRVAPDRSRDEASGWLRSYLGDLMDEGDRFEVLDWAPSALPAMMNDRLRALVELTGRPVRAKLGWTDVATFGELGIAATNYGAGDPELAHTSGEFVTEQELDEFARVLGAWLR